MSNIFIHNNGDEQNCVVHAGWLRGDHVPAEEYLLTDLIASDD